MGVVNDPLYLILSGGAILESFTAIFGEVLKYNF